MANTYIQNFIKTRQQQFNAPVAQNDVPKKDVIVKPETPKGHLVKENVIQSIGSSATGLVKTGGYFIDAINGKGTDYSVGRINDGARFLGSLGIAGALASTAKNPKAKVMEFVGFSTWFASMSLWPKMIGSVIKTTKGVDINQEYIDSYGRRKKFFEDAQYITWDLYSNKDLQKMGEKLGIPKNIENRNEAIKEKAKQVSIQGNTLMMLTAGFATPIATALVCNGLENPVSKVIEKTQLLIAGNSLKKLNREGLMTGSDTGLQQLNTIIGSDETVKLNAEQVKKVKDLFGSFKATGIGVNIEKDLNLFLSPVIHLDQKAKDGLRNALILDNKTLAPFADGAITTIAKLRKALTIQPEDFDKKIIGSKTTLDNGTLSIKGSVRRYLNGKLDAIEKSSKINLDKIELLKKVEASLAKEAENHKTISIPRKVLENFFKIGHDFEARKNILEGYAKATIGNIADSQTANHWENAPIKILNALGMDKKTLTLIENDPVKSPERIFNHLVELAKDDTKLNKAVAKIAKIADTVVEKESKAAEKLTAAWEKTEKDIKENHKKLVLEDKAAIKNSIKDNAKKSEDRLAAAKSMQTLRKVRNSQRKALEDAINLEKTNIENKLMNFIKGLSHL